MRLLHLAAAAVAAVGAVAFDGVRAAPTTPLPPQPPPLAPTRLAPSEAVAARRGPAVFNAVHDAMRQWGSSVHHNGMTVFPATVPKGVLFYHGSPRKETPKVPEWLAYEIEHAEMFAGGPPPPPGGPPGGGGGGSPPGGPPGADKALAVGGYLHVYRTTRALRYLYRERADDLCRFVAPWGLHGVIRLEAGFEIIHCDFFDGLELVRAMRIPPELADPDSAARRVRDLEYKRAVSERYSDIGAARTAIDYSRAVSALFFNVNITNPDPTRPDLPRLAAAHPADLADIKAYLANVLTKSAIDDDRVLPTQHPPSTDWRGVTDLIVARYADRLLLIADPETPPAVLRAEIHVLTATFVDAESDNNPADTPAAAIARCANHYLPSAALNPHPTRTDRAIAAALRAVTTRICATLFDARRRLLLPSPSSSSTAAAAAAATVARDASALVDHLAWARFRRCPRGCALGEVCVVPMWPFGSVDEYYAPRCSNGTSDGGKSYWGGRGRV
ncbi:hypothetical protein DFJ73DRAFT_955060 [Zopfochytrium polystomum]|nr:hypothetical protein DFJ73DRAFT_955060 [Zopfochytrium polystomum]